MLRRVSAALLAGVMASIAWDAAAAPPWTHGPAPPWRAPRWELSGGFPGLPPPVSPDLIWKFGRLMAGYNALDVASRCSFAQWLALNGVSDPREWYCMMWLYWQYVNRIRAS